MVLECGPTKKEILTLDNGSKAKPLVLVYILKLMLVSMKVALSILLKMEKEMRNFHLETSIKDTILMVNSMEVVTITGKMVVFTKDSSKMVSNMVMESFIRHKIMINTKDSSLQIVDKAMEYIRGDVVMCTKDNITLILDTVMDRCSGMMVLFTKEHG